jgi:hypothetical protein
MISSSCQSILGVGMGKAGSDKAIETANIPQINGLCNIN